MQRLETPTQLFAMIIQSADVISVPVVQFPLLLDTAKETASRYCLPIQQILSSP
jgi:hypothetical protein